MFMAVDSHVGVDSRSLTAEGSLRRATIRHPPSPREISEHATASCETPVETRLSRQQRKWRFNAAERAAPLADHGDRAGI
jgi:hypothetical protein